MYSCEDKKLAKWSTYEEATLAAKKLQRNFKWSQLYVFECGNHFHIGSTENTI